jgi:hypothetical protein
MCRIECSFKPAAMVVELADGSSTQNSKVNSEKRALYFPRHKSGFPEPTDRHFWHKIASRVIKVKFILRVDFYHLLFLLFQNIFLLAYFRMWSGT